MGEAVKGLIGLPSSKNHFKRTVEKSVNGDYKRVTGPSIEPVV